MNVVVVSNGDIGDANFVKELLPEDRYVICADGGTRHLEKLGLFPDMILGDFDSASQEGLCKFEDMGVPIQVFPKIKDRTDTQIAVDLAIEMKASRVYLLGALGSRWDHSYANVMLLYRLARHNITAQILHSHNLIMVSNSVLEIDGTPGQFLSLVPMGERVRISSTKGLQYAIEDMELPLDYPVGISNVFTEEKAVINIDSGWVIAIKARD